MGRFMSPDPSKLAYADQASPQSLNFYSYVRDNPLVNIDPTGTCDVVIGGITQSPGGAGTTGQQAFANGTGAISAYPYAGGTVAQGVADVSDQGFAPNGATAVAVNALQAAAQTPGPINVTTFSGGAQAFISAINSLPDIAARINNVTYLSPGVAQDTLLFTGSGITTALTGTGLADDLATSQNKFQFDTGVRLGKTGCAHDADCIFSKNAALLKSRSGSPCTADTLKTFYRGQTLIGPRIRLSALDSLRRMDDLDSEGYSTHRIIY